MLKEYAPVVLTVKPFEALLFSKSTPDIEDLEPVEVYKLPPIPTPPVTTNAPDVVDVEAVVDVIATPEAVNPIALIFPDTFKILLVVS
jgi:hypothetical protein